MNAIPGPILALPTPFAADGALDPGALRALLQLAAAAGVPAVLCNGSTGEFPALQQHERQRIVEWCRRFFPGVVLNNISHTCAATVRELARHSADFADAVLVLPPYYFADVSPEGLTTFYAEVLTDAPVDVLLYNFPRHTQLPLTADIVTRLAARYPRLVGVKDSAGTLDLGQALARQTPRLQTFVGSDSQALATRAAGLAGSVSGASVPLPEPLVALAAACDNGNDAQAARAQQAVDTWGRALAAVPGHEVARIKAALAARLPGFPRHVRPPLVEVEEKSAAELRRTLTLLLDQMC